MIAIVAIIAIIALLILHWDWVSQAASDAWAWIVQAWNDAGGWFKANVIDPVSNWFSQAWEDIKGFFSGAWTFIQGIWQAAGDWFTRTITDPIKSAFETALGSIQSTWESTFNGIRDFVKGIINGLIDLLNGLLGALTGGLNGMIDALNSISVHLPEGLANWLNIPADLGINIANLSVPQIPRLATGAVIPPNSQFAAILGDQRTGTNIEAPADLIRQIVGEEIEARSQSNQFVMRFEGSLGELVRTLKPHIDRENVRVGTNLIVGSLTQ
jgi:hypothetical protein